MNILCYGDSNTYGLMQDWKHRFPRFVRWPGRLQAMLGGSHYVIEDGLVGRTCASRDVGRYGRSAMDFLPVALECHAPLDYLILAFGTNDCKVVKARSVEEAASGMEKLVQLAQEKAPNTKILIVTSAPMHAPVLEIDPDFDDLSIRISEELHTAHQQIAEKYGCLYLDAGSVTRTADGDGEHLDAEGHAALANAVATILLEDMKGAL